MTVIENISFVVITYNEEHGIKKCLDSLAKIKMSNCEVVCVDSGSSDNTIKYVKQFEGDLNNLFLYQISGYSSAALGRNIGLENASKEYVFFIDGDIEVNTDFIHRSLKIMASGEADAVTGGLEEYQYDSGYTKIIKKLHDRFNIRCKKIVNICGGCFIARRSALNETGLYIANFKKNEDIDYSLRFSEQHNILAIPFSMGIHHTIAYDNNSRLIAQFFQEHRYYGKILLKNILCPKNTLALLKRYSGLTFGFIFYMLLVVSCLAYFIIDIKIILSILIFDIGYGLYQKKSIQYRLYLHYVAPIIAVVSAFIPLQSESKATVNKLIP